MPLRRNDLYPRSAGDADQSVQVSLCRFQRREAFVLLPGSVLQRDNVSLKGYVPEACRFLLRAVLIIGLRESVLVFQERVESCPDDSSYHFYQTTKIITVFSP